jgi:cyclin-dependent kinase 8/11
MPLHLTNNFTVVKSKFSWQSKMPLEGYLSKKRVQERYKIVGFISSGTYGKVYKAIGRNGQLGEFAIKR